MHAEAARLGLDLYRLPSTQEARYGTIVADGSDAIDTVLDRLRREQALVTTHEEEIRNNLYEFDQVTVQCPERAVYHRVHPAPHCRAGEQYLGRWGFTLELLEQQGESVVVPRAGIGPRVYGMEEAGRIRSVASDSAARQSDVAFPIDLVYTWVDSDDPVWQRQRAAVAGEASLVDAPTAAVNAARWYSRDELKYSMRSAWMYAPFVRNVYIVTNGQVPAWLTTAPNVHIVEHARLYEDADDLPTFNSNHIETVLHRIPDLAEHFLYLNDDFFFAAPVTPQTFFTESGLCRIFHTNRHLDDRPVGAFDRATVAAHKNTRDALAREIGFRPSRKFKHAPYVMRRSVWYEIEDIFGEDLRATRHNRFRSSTDLNGQFLYCHYAMAKGYGVAARIGYGYVEILDEAFEQRLARLDHPNIEVFCINDANSTEDNVDQNEAALASYLERRFPEPAPWERSAAYFYDGARPEPVSTTDPDTFEREVRALGVAAAKATYQALLQRSATPVVASKLVRLCQNTGDTAQALDALAVVSPEGERRQLATLDLLSRGDADTASVADLVPTTRETAFFRGLSMLGRTVESEFDYERFESVARRGDPDWQASPVWLLRLAAAARRAGQPTVAHQHLLLALERAETGAWSVPGRARESQRLTSPWDVVDDLHELAVEADAEIFADAGTLLGLVREGNFLAHDYDIDFSCRSEEAFSRLRDELARDWRFEVMRVRTPDTLVQARHVNRTLVDVFLHRFDGVWWLKTSHVYGWRFADYELTTQQFNGRSLLIPTPTEPHLVQMYGEDWRRPQPGFDSRLTAPNSFFPDRDEIICTVLNKLVMATLRGQQSQMQEYRDFLLQKLDAELPSPVV